MATIVELDGVAPTIGEDVFLAPTAVLVGDVRIADRANIWFGAVLRGDVSHIEIGPGCSIQDTAVIHCATELPTVIGSDVVVGHGAMLEGCTIEDGALIGMGAIVLQHATVGAGAMVAAGAVVAERQRVAPRSLAAGVPARTIKKELSGSSLAWTGRAAVHYQELREQYLRTSRVMQDEGPLRGIRGTVRPRPDETARPRPDGVDGPTDAELAESGPAPASCDPPGTGFRSEAHEPERRRRA